MSLFALPPAVLICFIIRWVKLWSFGWLLDIIATGPIPKHMAFEMDGNRRYARKMNKEGKEGHLFGLINLIHVLKICGRVGVQCVTVYAFAIENFNRPQDEVDTLMQLAEQKGTLLIDVLNKNGIRFNLLGRREFFPESVQATLAEFENMTRHNTTAELNVCAAYSSEDEITTAVQCVIQNAIDSDDLDGSTITEESIHSQLSTSLAGSPPLDIFVRTSGVKRLSGFLTWQCCENTQIHVVDACWPEFGLFDVVSILLQYQRKVWAEQKERSVCPTKSM